MSPDLAQVLSAVDAKRGRLSLPLSAVASAIGVHPAMFSRMRRGLPPSEENLQAVITWLGEDCATCQDEPEFTSAVIVLLPAADDPVMTVSSVTPSPHCTIVWLGDATDASPVTDDLVAEIREAVAGITPFCATVTGRSLLGEDDAEVALLDLAGDLEDFRDLLLAQPGIRALFDSTEQFPEFTPHVTLGYPDTPPREDYDEDQITFDRIALWIGGDQVFELALGAEEETTEAVWATGLLSDSDDAETIQAVNRVRELLLEGAVGVSVALDMHPDDVKTIADAPTEEDETGWPIPILPEGFVARQRIRHVAIVDTPAFADARFELGEDGSLSGFVVFEAQWTGDFRIVEEIDLESSRTPCPIIWDRYEGDHTGMTVGYVTEFEWRNAEPSSKRPSLDDEAITASLAPLTLAASFFEQRPVTRPEPMRISQPDAQGFRSIYGLAAPAGVCHRSSMVCWTWPGDVDKTHRHFHTGSLLRLDNGNDIRVGALTIGGAHLDAALASQGVSARDTSNHRDNANRVFALVRVWESKFGLMMSGVIPPDVSAADVTRALACSPSIEFWPEKSARTLVGLHLVPTPALPVLASVGSASFYGTDTRIELEPEASGEHHPEAFSYSREFENLAERLEDMNSRIWELLEKTTAILNLIPIDDIEIE